MTVYFVRVNLFLLLGICFCYKQSSKIRAITLAWSLSMTCMVG